MSSRFRFAAVLLAFATVVLPLLRLVGTDCARTESIGALRHDSSDESGTPSKAWSGDARGTDFGGVLSAHAPDAPPASASAGLGSGFAHLGRAGFASASDPLFLRLRRLRI